METRLASERRARIDWLAITRLNSPELIALRNSATEFSGVTSRTSVRPIRAEPDRELALAEHDRATGLVGPLGHDVLRGVPAYLTTAPAGRARRRIPSSEAPSRPSLRAGNRTSSLVDGEVDVVLVVRDEDALPFAREEARLAHDALRPVHRERFLAPELELRADRRVVDDLRDLVPGRRSKTFTGQTSLQCEQPVHLARSMSTWTIEVGSGAPTYYDCAVLRGRPPCRRARSPHRPEGGPSGSPTCSSIDPGATWFAGRYEDALRRFHVGLMRNPPTGFLESVALQLPAAPWRERSIRPVYVDWYLVEGFRTLDPIREVAYRAPWVRSHRAIARRAADGWGALYAAARPALPGRATAWYGSPPKLARR